MFKKNSEPKLKYQVKNWSEYNKSLKQRGSLTLWLEEEIESYWFEKSASGNKGASNTYSDLAIETFLSVMALYHLPLRAAEGFICSLFKLVGISLPVPEYTTVSRRRKTLEINLSRCPKDREIHVVVDSTGIKIFGEGEWKVRTHGWQKRRTWRKLHLGIDESSHEIVASIVSTNNVSDGEVLPDLLEQVIEPISQVSADGAYDWMSCYEVIESYQAQPVIPPRKNAKIRQRKKPGIKPLARDETIRKIRKMGEKNWKIESNYHRRSLAETGMFRIKQIFGSTLASKNFKSQAVDLFIRCGLLNRMSWLGMPQTVVVIDR